MNALHTVGNYTSVTRSDPHTVQLNARDHTRCTIPAREGAAQMVIDYFKTWFPAATRKLHQDLTEKARVDRALLRQRLQAEREAEERLLRVNQNLRV